MVIGEDTAAALGIVGEGEEGDGGDLPRTVCAPALLSHLSLSTISFWLAELIMEKWGKRASRDAPPPLLWRSDKFSSSQRPRATADSLVRIVSFIKHSAALWQLFRCVNNAALYKMCNYRSTVFPLLERNAPRFALSEVHFISATPTAETLLLMLCFSAPRGKNQLPFSVSIISLMRSHSSTGGLFAVWRLNTYSWDLRSRFHLSSYFLNALCFFFYSAFL